MLPRRAKGWAASLILSTLIACASGARYRPSEWRPAGEGRWAATVEGLDIETAGVAGSGPRLAVELALHNTSLAPVSVDGARLSGGGRAVECTPPPAGQASARAVPAGQTRRVALEFRLDAPGHRTFADPDLLVLRLRSGNGETRELEVALVRE